MSKLSWIFQNFHEHRDGTVHTLDGTEYIADHFVNVVTFWHRQSADGDECQSYPNSVTFPTYTTPMLLAGLENDADMVKYLRSRGHPIPSEHRASCKLMLLDTLQGVSVVTDTLAIDIFSKSNWAKIRFSFISFHCSFLMQSKRHIEPFKLPLCSDFKTVLYQQHWPRCVLAVATARNGKFCGTTRLA